MLEHDSDLIGSDSGYEAGNEWAGGQTVGEWRRSRQRRTRPPLRTTMETSTDTEEEAGDEEYEADDEWSRRPKISQIRKYMKRKKWGRPRTPTETEDSGR